MCLTVPVYQREFVKDDRFIYRFFFADTLELVGEDNENYYPTIVYFSIEFN